MSKSGFGDFQDIINPEHPYADSKYPRPVEPFLELPLPEDAKRKFLWDNCARLYGFEE